MIILIFVVIIGLFFGSFVNAWVWRTKTGKNILTGRSECPQCHTQLKWYENIPLLSFVMLKGKCGHCKKPISIRYPIVELTTGLLFGSLFLVFRPSTVTGWVELVLWLMLTTLLVSAFIYDLKWMLLPLRFTMPALVISILLVMLAVFENGIGLVYPQIIAGVGLAVFYLALWLFTRGKAIGDGDILLGLIFGLVLLLPQFFVGLFATYLVGAGVGVYLMLVKGKTKKTQVPFGPFLIFGLYFGLFFGNFIAWWYLGLV